MHSCACSLFFSSISTLDALCNDLCKVLSNNTGRNTGRIGYMYTGRPMLFWCISTGCAFSPICPAWCVCRFEGPECNVDINECLRQTMQCAPNAGCINTEGAYNCTCWPGYTGTACFPNQTFVQQQGNHMTSKDTSSVFCSYSAHQT